MKTMTTTIASVQALQAHKRGIDPLGPKLVFKNE